MIDCRLLMMLALLLPLGELSAATLRLDPAWQLLAAIPEQTITDDAVVLTPGEHHLLVRYEETLPARGNGDNDETLRSEPQLLTLSIGTQDLQLTTPPLSTDAQKRQYAKQPQVRVLAGQGREMAIAQREVKLQGLQLGVNYQQLLASQLMTASPAAMAGATATVSATAVASTSQGVTAGAAGTALDRQLQQLFLQATPEQRKRFVRWAVEQF
ncbi:MAG: DUF2057 domain-containing protein [Aeromonadaceae bacterium]